MTAKVWDLHSGRCIHDLLHKDAVDSVAISPDDRLIVSGSDDRILTVWDLESGRPLATIKLDDKVGGVAWHPGGRFILAGDASGNLYRFEYRAG